MEATVSELKADGRASRVFKAVDGKTIRERVLEYVKGQNEPVSANTIYCNLEKVTAKEVSSALSGLFIKEALLTREVRKVKNEGGRNVDMFFYSAVRGKAAPPTEPRAVRRRSQNISGAVENAREALIRSAMQALRQRKFDDALGIIQALRRLG